MLSPEFRKQVVAEIMGAINSGDVEAIRDMLNRGDFGPNSLIQGVPILVHAVKSGSVEMVSLLLEEGASSSCRFNGWDSMGWAVREENLPMMKLLADKGADMSSASDRGWSLLGFAVDRDSEEMVRFLVDRGCSPDDIFSVGGDTFTPRTYAHQYDKESAAAILDTLEVTKKTATSTSTTTTTSSSLSSRVRAAAAADRKKAGAGNHWNSVDLSALAKSLEGFASGEEFDALKVYNAVSERSRAAVMKRLKSARGEASDEARGTEFEDLRPEQWKQVQNVLEGMAKEKEKPSVKGKGKKGTSGGDGDVSLSSDKKLSFVPLNGYLWYPGDDVLYGQRKLTSMEPPMKQQRVYRQGTVGNVNHMTKLLKEIQQKRKP